MLQTQPCGSRSAATGGSAHFQSRRPASSPPSHPLGRTSAQPSKQGNKRDLIVVQAENQRVPVMRELEGSSGGLSATEMAPVQTGRIAAIDQIPVAQGSRAPPVVLYVPKSVSIFDAMKFNGPAPEAVNGRLAMIGFMAGAITEFQTGVPLEQQALMTGPPTFVIAALIVYASLVPILKAAKSEPFGFFTPRAEVTNGRAAMLGFAVLLLLEHSSGVCFF